MSSTDIYKLNQTIDTVEVQEFKTGNLIFAPTRHLSNNELTELLFLMGLQISADLYENLSPLLKTQFKPTKSKSFPIYQ